MTRRHAPTSWKRLAIEAMRNSLSRFAVTLGLSLAFAALLLGTLVTETNATVSARTYAQRLISQGYSTLLIERDPSADGGFRWQDCDAVHAFQGAKAVLGMQEPASIRLWSKGGPEIVARTATGDVVDYLRKTDPVAMEVWRTAQMFVDVAAPIARTSGSVEYSVLISTPQGAEPLKATTALLTSLGGGSSGNAMLIGPTIGIIGTCAIFVDTDQRTTFSAAISNAFPVLDGFSQRWALTNADRFDSPRLRFEGRASKWYWLLASTGFVVLWLLAIRLRRNDHAVYAVAGLGPARLGWLAVCELAVVVGAGLLVAMAVAVPKLNCQLDFARVGLVAALRAAMASAVCSVFVSLHVARRVVATTLDALKDR